MSTNRVFLRGAFVLASAAIVSKLLGSVYTVILQNMIGDRGMGLYQMAYPIYATLLIISTAGFPVAVSKFVSEYVAIGDKRGAAKVYRISLWFLMILGFICAVGLYVSADFFARVSGDPAAVYAIQAVAPALFIVPIMSTMRGYFQGWQMMSPTAVSQVSEQLVRVGTILAGAYLVMRFGLGETLAAAAAAFGAVSGGLAGTLIMFYYLWRHRRLGWARAHQAERRPSRLKPVNISTWSIVKRLVYYAVPVSLGALVVPLISNVDAFTVTNLLKDGGLSQTMATQDFGLLAGRAVKLMMFPAALASSLAAALMPSVSEAHALRDGGDTVSRVLMGLRVTILFSLPAAVGMFILAKPIDIALFTDAAGYHSIQIVGFAALFSSIQIALAASLQGIGAVYLPLRSLLIGTAVKVALNFILVPRLGIDGAALATVGSYGLASVLNFQGLSRLLALRLNWKEFVVKPVAATFVMGAVAYAIFAQWQRLDVTLGGRVGAAVITLFGVSGGALVYGFMLVIVGSLGEKEVASVPKLGKPLVKTFRKLGLFAR